MGKLNIRRHRDPRWVLLEGIDGVGKSTLARGLSDRIRAEYGKNPMIVEEPHSHSLGRWLAERVFGDDVTQLGRGLMFAGLVTSTIDNIIRPMLEDGGFVVSCRSFVSTIVYQGEDASVRDILIQTYNRILDRWPTPLVVLVGADPGVVKTRVNARPDETLTDAGLQRLVGAQARYHEMAEEQGWPVIDTSGVEEEASLDILWGIVNPSLKKKLTVVT